MSITQDIYSKNAEHVSREFRLDAETAFTDENTLQSAIAERGNRAQASLNAIGDNELSADSLLSYEVSINGGTGSVFRIRPSADALLLLLAQNAKDGDKIVTTSTFVGGRLKVENTWPITLKQAEGMTSGLSQNPAAATPGSAKKGSIKNLGQLGNIGFFLSSGKPLWAKPRFKAEKTHGKTGNLELAVSAGWLYKSLTLMWSARKKAV